MIINLNLFIKNITNFYHEYDKANNNAKKLKRKVWKEFNSDVIKKKYDNLLSII